MRFVSRKVISTFICLRGLHLCGFVSTGHESAQNMSESAQNMSESAQNMSESAQNMSESAQNMSESA